MGYSTYFNGKMEIELEGTPLENLQKYLSENMKDKNAIIIDEKSLVVEGEWKDCGLMQSIVLFVEQNGKLNSGCILCSGEDHKDVWEISINENKPFMKELGTATTLSRSESKEWFYHNSPIKVTF